MTITTDDLGAALALFAIVFTKAMMDPANQTGPDVLEHLANLLDDQAAAVKGTPASEALAMAATILLKTEGRAS